MKKYKTAIIGCGWIGMGAQLDLLRPLPASHAQAVDLNERLDLIAFIDTDLPSLEQAAKLYPSVKRYADVDIFLMETIPDLVVISTHADSHCYYIKKAAMAGVKLILCEKPISNNIREAEEAIELCHKKGTILLINHMRRFDKLIRSFKSYINNEYVRDTTIGRVKSVIASYDNGLYHGGTHIVDLMRFFLGEVKSVCATTNKQNAAGQDDCNVDAILEFEFGNAILYYFNAKEFALAELNFRGEKGCIHFKNMWGIDIEVVGVKSSLEFSAYKEPDYENTRKFGGSRSFMTGTYEHVVDCLDGIESPLSSGEDALKTLQVLNKMEESARLGGVKLKIN